MRLLDVTPEFNSIQIFRLECMYRALKSFDPYDPRAEKIILTFTQDASRYLGFEPSAVPLYSDLAKSLGTLERQPATPAQTEYKRIAEDFARVLRNEYTITSWHIPEQITEHLKTHLQSIVDADTQKRAEQYAEYMEFLRGLLVADVALARRGTDKRTEQDRTIDAVRRYLKFQDSDQDKKIPKEREREANNLILTFIKARYDVTLKTMERALDGKRKRHRKDKVDHPVIRNIQNVGNVLGLSKTEQDLMMFYSELASGPLRETFAAMRGYVWLGDDFHRNLAIMIDCSPDDTKLALAPESQIREANLLVQHVPQPEKKDDKKAEPLPFSTKGTQPLEDDYYIPEATLRALRAERSNVGSLVQTLLGADNPRNGFTLSENFKYVATDVRRVTAVMVNGLLEPQAPGRKGRSISGPAGGGKNTLSDVIAREAEKILNERHNMDVRVKTVLVAMATNRDAYGRMKAEQLSGKDRVYAHKTADVLAAKMNEKVLREKKGEFIILIIDEADRDFMNPKLTGSSAEDGIKDLINHHLLNLKTSCLLLANASHKGQEHITRRVGPGIFLTVQPFEARFNLVKSKCEAANFNFDDAIIDDLTSRFAHTVGVLDACIEDVSLDVKNIRAGGGDITTPEITSLLFNAFAQIERQNNGGVRPIPVVLRSMPEFDFPSANPKTPNFQEQIEHFIAQKDFTGQNVLLTGPSGSGKKTLVHWIAKKIGRRVLTIQQYPDGNDIDAAERDNALILVDQSNIVNLLTQSLSPITYTTQLKHPVFYVNNTEVAPPPHAAMRHCFHLDYLNARATLMAFHRLAPDFPVDERVQKIEELTISDVIAVRERAVMIRARKERPTPMEMVELTLEQKGHPRSNIVGLKPTYAALMTLEKALAETAKGQLSAPVTAPDEKVTNLEAFKNRRKPKRDPANKPS